MPLPVRSPNICSLSGESSDEKVNSDTCICFDDHREQPSDAQKRFLAKQIRIEGCPEVIWIQVEDDYWLGYGVKVVMFY